MGNSSTNDSETIKILQDLVINNPELEQLEGLLDRFNIFEALGAIRQEVRHSDFLAFLLNPRQNHGLGDLFIKRLLQEAIDQADDAQPFSPIDLDIWDLDEIEIRREWQSIDILVLDEQHKFAVIIENKLYSTEHDDQLTRYKRIVQQHYPGYGIVGLFLSPEGVTASNTYYIPISYGLICQLVEDIVRNRETTLGRDVLVIMNNYAEMLRRYIVGESELEKLCQQIYRKHQRALDLIYEYRPDQQAEINEYLCDLINSNPLFELDHTSKSYINFVPKSWDTPELKSGQGWTRSGRMLLFQFTNLQDLVRISLVIGPGPENYRRKIFEVIRHRGSPFKGSLKTLGRLWTTVYSRNILTKPIFLDKSIEDLELEINRKWNEFLEHDFKMIDNALSREVENLNQIEN